MPSAAMRRARVVFVDADDTLWENYRWFQIVLDGWTALASGQGVERSRALATLHAVEDRNIPVTGYGAAPFVRSVVEAFHELVPDAGLTLRREVAHFARRAETTIREHPIHLLPGVAEAIPTLAVHARVVVLTKGRADEQNSKVERSGLARWFDGVCVVAEKSPATYAEAVGRFEAKAADCWMVGNSATSDVNPALRSGLGAVHVPHPAPWHRDVGPLEPGAHVVRSFAEVPGIVLRGIPDARI